MKEIIDEGLDGYTIKLPLSSDPNRSVFVNQGVDDGGMLD